MHTTALPNPTRLRAERQNDVHRPPSRATTLAGVPSHESNTVVLALAQLVREALFCEPATQGP